MTYPLNWQVSAQNSSASALMGVGLTVSNATARLNANNITSFPSLVGSGSLYVMVCNTIAVLTHSGVTPASLGAGGTLRTLAEMVYFNTGVDTGTRIGLFCLRGTASAGGDDTFSGPCYTFEALPAVADQTQSTWRLMKYLSGLGGTGASILASGTSMVSMQAGLPLTMQLSWTAGASSVQLTGTGTQSRVSQFPSYLSLANSVSLTATDSTNPLSGTSGTGLWIKNTTNGFLGVFDMTAGSAA